MQFNVRSFPKLAGGLAVGGMLAGLAISFVVSPRYISQAALQVIPGPGRSIPPFGIRRNLNEYFMQMQQEILSRTSLSRSFRTHGWIFTEVSARGCRSKT